MAKEAPPLAFRIRPERVDDIIGQIDAKAYIEDFISGKRSSAILWGPPGSGKTTVANIIGKLNPESFFTVSAVLSGLQEVRKVTGSAQEAASTPIMFIDEIHRFNKAQQDALLPHVEDGSVIMIGATTENPSFAVISPLLSRMRVIVLKALNSDDVEKIVRRALADDSVKNTSKTLTDDSIRAIAESSDGDARAALNLLELILKKIDKNPIGLEDIKNLLSRPLYHDRTGDAHYDTISAFHKCVRAGDVNASLYWLGRMLEAGEDRLYILRRMLRMASEDIGMAEPNALRVVLSARDAFTMLGTPEGELAIYQAVVYLACAPKSNAVYLAESKVKALVATTGKKPVPLSIRNAPTKLMKELGYSKGYVYAHNDWQGALDMEYMPEGTSSDMLYVPTGSGFEKRIKELIDAREKARRDRIRGNKRPPEDKA